MPINKQTLAEFIDLLPTVREAFGHYDLDGRAGPACARGTLTSRLNNLTVIAAALETREETPKDIQELDQLSNTLKWLSEDKDVLKDFKGVELTMPATKFAAAHPDIGVVGDTDYETIIEMLRKGVLQITAEYIYPLRQAPRSDS